MRSWSGQCLALLVSLEVMCSFRWNCEVAAQDLDSADVEFAAVSADEQLE